MAATIVVLLLVWAGHSVARTLWLLVVTPATDNAMGHQFPAETASHLTQFMPVDLAAVQQALILTDSTAFRANELHNERVQTAEGTRLDLRLHGAVVGSSDADSRAIIAGGGAQHVYRPGDNLRGNYSGVSLLEIYVTHVVLDNNGRIESLWMYDEDTSSAAITETLTSQSITHTILRAPERLQEDAPQAAQHRATETPVSFAEHVRLQVFLEDGAVRGLQLRYGSRQVILSRFGLQVGDIITAVDGIAVSSPTQLQSFLQKMEQKSTFSLSVRRADTTMIIDITQAMWSS